MRVLCGLTEAGPVKYIIDRVHREGRRERGGRRPQSGAPGETSCAVRAEPSAVALELQTCGRGPRTATPAVAGELILDRRWLEWTIFAAYATCYSLERPRAYAKKGENTGSVSIAAVPTSPGRASVAVGRVWCGARGVGNRRRTSQVATIIVFTDGPRIRIPLVNSLRTDPVVIPAIAVRGLADAVATVCGGASTRAPVHPREWTGRAIPITFMITDKIYWWTPV